MNSTNGGRCLCTFGTNGKWLEKQEESRRWSREWKFLAWVRLFWRLKRGWTSLVTSMLLSNLYILVLGQWVIVEEARQKGGRGRGPRIRSQSEGDRCREEVYIVTVALSRSLVPPPHRSSNHHHYHRPSRVVLPTHRAPHDARREILIIRFQAVCWHRLYTLRCPQKRVLVGPHQTLVPSLFYRSLSLRYNLLILHHTYFVRC